MAMSPEQQEAGDKFASFATGLMKGSDPIDQVTVGMLMFEIAKATLIGQPTVAMVAITNAALGLVEAFKVSKNRAATLTDSRRRKHLEISLEISRRIVQLLEEVLK